jgi:hypothetical protein
MYQSTQMIDLMQRAKALSGEYENVVLTTNLSRVRKYVAGVSELP